MEAAYPEPTEDGADLEASTEIARLFIFRLLFGGAWVFA
jgi:hypothetical protein